MKVIKVIDIIKLTLKFLNMDNFLIINLLFKFLIY